MSYTLRRQSHNGFEYHGHRKPKGLYCEPCAMFYDEGPESKPLYGRRPHYSAERGKFGRVSSLWACSECHMALKWAFKPVKDSRECANCGHYKSRHVRQWCAYPCKCQGYSNGKPVTFRHPAHKYLKTVNGDFRGLVSNGVQCAITTANGYAIFFADTNLRQ